MVAAAQNSRGFGAYISKRQACADADVMFAGVKAADNRAFNVPSYVSDMVDRVFSGEIDFETFFKLASGTVVGFPESLARSEKERRKGSANAPPAAGQARFSPKVVENTRRMITS